MHFNHVILSSPGFDLPSINISIEKSYFRTKDVPFLLKDLPCERLSRVLQPVSLNARALELICSFGDLSSNTVLSLSSTHET